MAVGALAQVILSETDRLTKDALLSDSYDPRLVIFLSEGLAFCVGIYMARGVSGGHLNPIISFALAVRGTLRWSHMLAAWLGQYLGAFLGMTAVYSIYYSKQPFSYSYCICTYVLLQIKLGFTFSMKILQMRRMIL